MENIKEKLKSLELEPKEVEVYLAVLSHTKSTITDIARSAKIKRTTVYQHLDILIEKGLVYKTVMTKRVFYSAQNPDGITKIFEKRKREIDRKKVEFEKVIPELKMLFSRAQKKPGIEFYEGKEGIMKVYEKVMLTHQNVYSIFSPDSIFRLFSKKENDELLQILYESGGVLHNLVSDTEVARKHVKQNKFENVKYKLLPKGFDYETDMLVWGNTLALISFKNLVGVIIEDEAIAELQRNLFKLVWKTTK